MFKCGSLKSKLFKIFAKKNVYCSDSLNRLFLYLNFLKYSPYMSKPLVVFIVDDDVDDTEMFCEVISNMNNSIKCTAASNSREALQLLENEHVLPDFLFLDLNMPGMNGKQLLEQLKQNKKLASIPVIIYSTSKLEADKEETRRLGACYFLSKPNSMQQLKKDLEFVFNKKYEQNQPIIT